MNKELIARTYGAVFNQDIPTQEVTDEMCSELLDKLREMSDVYRDLYRTVREDLAPEDYGVWTGRQEREYCASQTMGCYGCPLYLEQEEYYGFRECDLWCGDALHPCDRTDDDCDMVDMGKYCERQNECEDCEYRDDCEEAE